MEHGKVHKLQGVLNLNGVFFASTQTRQAAEIASELIHHGVSLISILCHAKESKESTFLKQSQLVRMG